MMFSMDHYGQPLGLLPTPTLPAPRGSITYLPPPPPPSRVDPIPNKKFIQHLPPLPQPLGDQLAPVKRQPHCSPYGQWPQHHESDVGCNTITEGRGEPFRPNAKDVDERLFDTDVNYKFPTLQNDLFEVEHRRYHHSSRDKSSRRYQEDNHGDGQRDRSYRDRSDSAGRMGVRSPGGRDRRVKSRDRESRGKSRERETRGRSRDRETRGKSRDREPRRKSRDRQTRGKSRERETRGKSRERESRGKSREREPRGQYGDHKRRNRDRWSLDVSDSEIEPRRTATILIRGLGPGIDESDIRAELSRYSISTDVVNISLVGAQESGESRRGIAYLDFRDRQEALRFMDESKSRMKLETNWLIMHFSDEGHVADHDWSCNWCLVLNFRGRRRCFKCHREWEPSGPTGVNLVSVDPTDAILFRNINLRTQESSLWQTLFPFISNLGLKPPKNLRIEPCRQEPKFARLELNSVSDANSLLQSLFQVTPPLTVDNRTLVISYCKSDSGGGCGTRDVGAQAIAASQWSSAADTAADGAEPDLSRYQYEPTSGFYYDHSTGLYYDPTTRYFYNGETQTYCYWDAARSEFVPVAAGSEDGVTGAGSTATAGEGTSTPIGVEPPAAVKPFAINDTHKKEKEKKKETARKIAKDMEKWAKELNAKRYAAKIGVAPVKLAAINAAEQHIFDVDDGGTADIGHAVLEQKIYQVPCAPPPVETPPWKASVPVASAPDTSVTQLIESEESKLIDFAKLACLLCKRQFKDAATLEKHKNASELHRTNLAAWSNDSLPLLGIRPPAIAGPYRDRAAERRGHCGVDEMPPRKREEEETTITASVSATKPPIGGENIGNKMLKAMGWTGGGLGSKGQGRSDIVSVSQRQGQTGLGSRQSKYTPGPGQTYKSAIHEMTKARFDNID